MGPAALGARVAVWWPLDEAWYSGVVADHDALRWRHTVCYDDGDIEHTPLWAPTQLVRTALASDPITSLLAAPLPALSYSLLTTVQEAELQVVCPTPHMTCFIPCLSCPAGYLLAGPYDGKDVCSAVLTKRAMHAAGVCAGAHREQPGGVACRGAAAGPPQQAAGSRMGGEGALTHQSCRAHHQQLQGICVATGAAWAALQASALEHSLSWQAASPGFFPRRLQLAYRRW